MHTESGPDVKDVRKVYQENGNLMRFAEAFADRQALLADTPDTALIQVLRKLEPVVIVDESHNAGSELSIEMLKRLNPSHILELTATPRQSSNILCYVDDRELKRENMVKLPVIVYNRSSRQTVISDAIRLRGNLEQQAKAERKAGGDMLLEPEQLSENFSLSGQDAIVGFDMDSSGQIYKIDLDEENDEAIPKSYKAEQRESDYIRSQLQNKAPKDRISQCARFIADQINKNNRLDTSDVTDYVMRVINGMNEDDLSAMETSIPLYAQKIREKIESLEDAHRANTFRLWLESGKILVKPMYELPEAITPSDVIDSIPKSLYEAEKNDLNNFEWDVAMKISALNNVRWWHRNIDRKGFRLNGPVKNHYPDFLVMTESGKLILVETKGDYLINDDSKEKVSLGRSWQNKAGENYRYFMVFQDAKPDWDGAFTLDDFLKIIKAL